LQEELSNVRGSTIFSPQQHSCGGSSDAHTGQWHIHLHLSLYVLLDLVALQDYCVEVAAIGIVVWAFRLIVGGH
jgi:hypothetical protein